MKKKQMTRFEYKPHQALSQIFTDCKLVQNRLLNIMGCQIGRMLLSESFVRTRRRHRFTDLTDDERALMRDGYVIIEDFFDESTFESLVQEVEYNAEHFLGNPPSPDKFGIVREQVGLHKRPDRFPLSTALLLGNERLLRIVQVSEGWSPTDTFESQNTVLKYERLTQAVDPAEPILSREAEISSGDLHADTFHYVTKAFLLLSDMTVENAPYTYCPGSQRVSLRRLAWDYQNSIKAVQYTDGEYHNRVYPDEVKKMRLTAIPLEARANSLIVTNTFGFHLRGRMSRKGAVRQMLRMDFRSNPFGRKGR